MKTLLTAFPALTAGAGAAFGSANATRYFRLAGQFTTYQFGYEFVLTEGTWRTTVDDDGFIDDLEVYISANTRSDATTFTLMVNGVSSGYTATVGAGVTGWVGASGGPVAVNESDLLSVRMVTGAGSGSLTLDMIASSYEAGDGSTLAHFVTGGDYNLNQPPSTARLSQAINGLSEANSFASGWAGELGYQSWAARAGLDSTAESIRVDIPVNSTTVDCAVELFKNNAGTGLIATIPAGTTGRFRGTGSVDIAPGDLLDIRFYGKTGGGTGSLRIGTVQTGVRYDGNGYDVWSPFRSSSTLQGYSDQTYRASSPTYNITTDTATAWTRRKFYEGTLGNLWVRVNISGTTAGNWPVSVVRINGADSAVDLTVNGGVGGNVRYVNSTDTALLDDGDTVWFAFRSNNFSQAVSAWGFTVESNAAPPIDVPVTAGALEIDGGTPVVSADEFVETTAGELLITGGFPLAALDEVVPVDGGALVLTGSVPGVSVGISVAPIPGELLVEGTIPFLSVDLTAVATQGAALALASGGPPEARIPQAAVLALGVLVPSVAISQAAVLLLADAVPCVTRWCQVWLLTRTDGEEFAFTSHDEAITFKGRVCKPCASLMPSATEGSSELGTIGNMELTGIVDDDAITEFDLYSGKFDGCYVEVWEIAWSLDGTTPKRLAAGRTGAISHGRDGFATEVLGVGAQIQQQAVTQVVTAACRFVFGDARCGKDIEALRVSGVVSSAPPAAVYRIFTVASLAGDHPDGYFVRGVVEFTSGLNDGLRAEVKEYDGASGTFVLWTALPSEILAGDGMTATPGCELSRDACIGWANLVNFGGFPDVPGDDATSRTPDARY